MKPIATALMITALLTAPALAAGPRAEAKVPKAGAVLAKVDGGVVDPRFAGRLRVYDCVLRGDARAGGDDKAARRSTGRAPSEASGLARRGSVRG
mgnify:CR=1 FL=1